METSTGLMDGREIKMVRENSKKFMRILRTAVRWGGRLLALLIIMIIGLVIADSLHQKQCRAGPSHKGESYEFMGERLTFLNTGKETNGEVLEMDVSFKPTAETNILKWQDTHVHPYQEERFKVISGSVRFRVGDHEQVLAPGQSISGPPKVVHGWNSADGKEIHMLAEFRPALHTDAAAASFFRAGSTEGKIPLLQAMVIMSEFDGLAYPPNKSPFFMQTFVKVLAPIGRLLGYKAC
jgi:quercetin dioxygenase-like cupin family protein